MPLFTDQLGRRLYLNQTPTRIVSLVPSQTELLYDLGLNTEVGGITKFCVHPETWFRNKIKVGGTKKIEMQIIKNIQPDLIIANKEENDKTQIEALTENYPVWISDIKTIDDALRMIISVGDITGKREEAVHVVTSIKIKFDALRREVAFISRINEAATAYLIWRKPYMTVGGDTFINDMMKCCGFKNMFENKMRYPEVDIDELKNSGCKILLLSSEPYPFTQKHIEELKPQLPGTKIALVDGEMFSWYGSRLLRAPDYFRLLLQEIQ